jgi:hypothetical protein
MYGYVIAPSVCSSFVFEFKIDHHDQNNPAQEVKAKETSETNETHEAIINSRLF